MFRAIYNGPGLGVSVQAVDKDYAAEEGDKLFPEYPTDEQLAVAFPEYPKEKTNEDILQQIIKLEATITQRTIREAALGLDTEGRLEKTNKAIADLRAQLVK